MSSLGAIIGVLCIIAGISRGTILSKSDISKCCKFDETLNARQECETTNRTGWEFQYSHMGSSRKPMPGFGNWTLIENKVPNCDRRIRIPAKPLLVVINGGLFSSALGKVISESDFCVDMDYVLICDTSVGNKTIVNRCCGEQAIYSMKSMSCRHTGKSRKVVDNDDIFFMDSLPCDQIVSVGFVGNETNLHNNGSVEVTNQLIPHESYCLEYTDERGKF